MRNQTVNLNLIPGGVSPVVHLSQFDQDADGSLIFNIYNGVVPYDLTDCVAHIQGHKPDDTIFDYECTVYATYVTAPTEYQMTVMAGQYPVELRISKNGASVGTANMIFSVEPSTGTGADLSHTDIPELVLQIEQAVVSSGASASAAEDSAEDAEAWAVGQINGSDVPNTDARYHNNSKYYAGQASTSATNAGNSETNAATSETNAEAWAVGERNGTPVTSGDPAYHNNAEYYADEADDSAEDSEAWAVGERDGVPVTSDDPTYHNNAKYWSQQSAYASVSTLTDVTLTNLEDGDLLQYDSDSQDWLNVPQSSITPADMTGATSGAAGTHGLVPAPAQGDQDKVLTGGGTWADMEDSKAYHTDDTAETTLDDADYVPFYDTSATAKRKSLWSNIKAKLKTYFDGIYLTSHQTIKQDGVTGAMACRLAACSASASTAAKTAIITAGTFGLETGARVTVGFAQENTADNPTLNINNTGAKDIYYNGVKISTDTEMKSLISNICDFIYENGHWNLLGKSIESGGHTILNDSGTSLAQQPNLQFKGMDVENDGNNSKTVVTPLTPDYVDAPYNSTTTYTKGMTCISENKRYRYINSNATSGHQPPDATYWGEESVGTQANNACSYSSSEVAIGKWTDGRTRYRKIITENFTYTGGSTNQEFRVDTGISVDTIDMDTVIFNCSNRPLYTDSAHQLIYPSANFSEYGKILGKGYSSGTGVQVVFITSSTAWSPGSIAVKFIVQIEYCYK